MNKQKFFRTVRPFRWVGLGGFVALTIVSLALATSTLTTPNWTAPGPVATTASSCGGQLVGPINALSPGTGTARFDCGGSPAAAAFSVSSAGSDVPNFALQPGQTSLGIVNHATADCTSQLSLNSAQATTLPVGSYDICINYTVTSTTSFAATALTWSS